MSVPADSRPRGLVWHKSTFSSGGGCVEVAHDGPLTIVRDTKDRGGASLTFNPREWAAFMAGVRAGEFDRPEDPPAGREITTA